MTLRQWGQSFLEVMVAGAKGAGETPVGACNLIKYRLPTEDATERVNVAAAPVAAEQFPTL